MSFLSRFQPGALFTIPVRNLRLSVVPRKLETNRGKEEYFDTLISFFSLFYKRNVKSRIAMYVFTLSILDIHEGKCGGYINARLAELTCSPIRLS